MYKIILDKTSIERSKLIGLWAPVLLDSMIKTSMIKLSNTDTDVKDLYR